MFNDIRLRHDLIDAALQLTSLGLNKGTAGNVSVRLDEDRFLITPSGMPATTLSAKHLPVMTLGTPGEWTGPRKPSSEWRFHLDLYAARPEVGAVVHTHAPFCTTLACLQKDIPPFHYMVAVAGGKTIRCASYAGHQRQCRRRTSNSPRSCH
ncbi:MAG: class II aldolase/adducin family protein [Rhodospirillaceae bacterium]